MNIKYLNHSSFKITGRTPTGAEISIVTDPFVPESVGYNYPTQKAHIVSLSHHHEDHNNTSAIEGIEANSPIIIDTPGEYEIGGLIINGIKSYHDDTAGSQRGPNTIYTYDFSEARIAHLGDLGHKLESEQSEDLENIDILMIPVGGFYTIGTKSAVEIIEELEPSVVIPMHYKTPKHTDSYKDLEELEVFIKELSIPAQEVKDYSIKGKKDLPNELTLIVFSA